MIVSYSGYPESSVTNQSSVMETSNTKKKNHQRKFAVPLRTLLGKNYSKKIQTDNCPLRQILDGIDKENDESSTEVKSTLNKFITRPRNDSNSIDIDIILI